MNIIYYLSEFPTKLQGYIFNEVQRLDQEGHNIAVCSFKKRKPSQKELHPESEDLDIPIKYVEQPKYTDLIELLSGKVLNRKILGELFSNPFYPFTLRQHARNLIRVKRSIEFIDSLDWEPDHLHTHFPYLSALGALYLSKYYNIPFTITEHTTMYHVPFNAEERTTKAREMIKYLFQESDRVITVSEYNKRYIQKEITSETPIEVIRAGIRPEKFNTTDEEAPNRVLTVSRFREKKGLLYALEAINIAREEIPGIEYHIIGAKGEMKEKVVEKVKELGIEENVDFLGEVSHEILIEELDQAQCFLLPCIVTDDGDRDGIPVSIMEAMAMKTPPVSTTVSGIPELVEHEKNGLLTEPRNAEATAEALIELLKDDVKRKEYGEEARKKVCRDFNSDKEVEKLEKIFRGLNSK